MHRRSAAHSTHLLMKMAMDDVGELITKHPEFDIKNPEILIASFVQSATSIFIHESTLKDDNSE